jgi:hypothetical protein
LIDWKREIIRGLAFFPVVAISSNLSTCLSGYKATKKKRVPEISDKIFIIVLKPLGFIASRELVCYFFAALKEPYVNNNKFGITPKILSPFRA